MSYLENPKTKGSGVVCAIPQTTRCPGNCKDCFFQSGRSYLEPLAENLPNMPKPHKNRVVRVNDGNDSNNDRELVIEATKPYPWKFFNTSFPQDLQRYPAPVVLTINPGRMTDKKFYQIDKPPPQLMFVRFRVNTWNLGLCDKAVAYYAAREVPVVLTFMAYHDILDIPEGHRHNYEDRVRTTNTYWAITTEAWHEEVMEQYWFNRYVYSCGKIEGKEGGTKCKHCGNCLREFFSTLERMK